VAGARRSETSRAVLVAATCSMLVLGLVAGSRVALPMRRAFDGPSTVLWAWQRPEDLRFVDPARVAVAALVGTVYIDGKGWRVEPRMNPLRLAPATQVLPVVRVEVAGGAAAALDDALAREVAQAIAELARGPAVQVDFDATFSQRPFARALLAELRDALPSPSHVSVTALASTCFDGGAAALGADEVVPMLFRMGIEGAPLRRRVERDGLPPPCDRAIGLITDEPRLRLPRGVRLYLFAPRAWNAQLLAEVLRETSR
jgi:hypothetical protein